MNEHITDSRLCFSDGYDKVETAGKRGGQAPVRVRHGDTLLSFGDPDSFVYTIKDPVGIHARPAGALVTLAKNYKSEIRFSAEGKTAAADSILSIMSLGAKQGTRLKVEAHGEDAREALSALREYLGRNL